MTTTNQAFIKAYRHDGAQSSPASPTIVEAARGEPVISAPAPIASASATVSERSAIYGPRPATDAVVMNSPQHRAHHIGEKQPLSSFIARPLHPVTQAESAESEFVRPGTTIASFQWPPVCRALAQQTGRELDTVADRLVKEAAAGRSLIAVLGLHRGAGATTTALCLAARLASRNRRVILVDGNFCNPRLAKWLEAVPTTGWQDVLKRGGPLADAIVRARDNRFDLLALDDRPPANAQRLVGGLQAIVTAGVLRHGYDSVLVDVGTFFNPASQPVVLELTRNMGLDIALAVTGPAGADARDLASIAAHLGRGGCELLGTIANRIAKPQAA